MRTSLAKLVLPVAVAAAGVGNGATVYPYQDTTRSFEERAADLVSRMTLEEKCSQLGRNTAAVPRLGLAKYDYWNEALHGIQNGTGEGTSFPMPLSLAQTWDEDLIRRVAAAISDECRGHNQPFDEGGRGRGLTYWCPTINLGRHPLWGRTNEAWGEDAYLAGMLSSAFVEGMKGEEPYLKTVPTIKHYALNNHENGRGSTSSDASEADIRDYYARVYRYVIERTDVPSLMSAYNAVNFTPSSANPFLLSTLLRDTFGFTGFVVSDCGAIDNIERQQKWRPDRNKEQVRNYRMIDGKTLADYVDENGVVTKPGSVAMALMAGCDMDCNGDIYPKQSALAHGAGLLDENEIALHAYRNLLARFKLGEFDPDEKVAYRGEAYSFASTVETPAHRALADEAAARGVVLLKNEDDILPLNARKIRRIAVVGDRADVCFLGNYCGKPKMRNRISVFAGISDYLFVNNPRTEITLVDSFAADGAIREQDADAIRRADVVVVMAADDHDDSSEGHDRETLTLTRNQDAVIRNVAALNPDTILFLQTSNMVELRGFKDKVKAILWSSQNGQGQGVGVARQIFGEVNPSGKLTFTWYAKESDLPGIRQYGLVESFLPEEKEYPAGGYTYQYFKGQVDYPFGYGLSYTTYAYANAKADKTAVDANGKVTVRVDVTNTGKRAGSEIVQAYVVYPKGERRPAKQLKGFAKVDLKPGETKTASITVDIADCCFWDGAKRVVPTGDYTIEIGASVTDIKAAKKVRVSGKLAETIKVLAVKPEGVAVKVGAMMTPQVTVCLKDDSFVAPEKAGLALTSADPSVAEITPCGKVRGVKPGVTTITVTANWKGSEKTATFPVAVLAADGSPAPGVVSDARPAAPKVKKPAAARKPAGVDKDELEEAIRVKARGDDFDPATLAAYNDEITKARRVFFNPKATQAEVDAATAAVVAMRENLRDFRHLVAVFPPANRAWSFVPGQNVWVNWSNCKDDDGRDITANLATHDPTRLQLRFTVTLTPSDGDVPFAKAIHSGSFIKLRSVNVAQKDNDPDLQVFGGNLQSNDEHNYGWNVQDYIQDWGRTEVVIPLATKNPDGTVGLPFIDKGFRADGTRRYSRGKIDWSMIDRFFMNINWTDAFKKTSSVMCRIENCRVVDVTIDEEREKVRALLDEKPGKGACDCPLRWEAYSNAVEKAERQMAGDSVIALRGAAAAVTEARVALGGKTVTDKSALRAALAARVKDLSRCTAETAKVYGDVLDAAKKVYTDPAAKQLDINRMVKHLNEAKEQLKLRKGEPRVVSTLLTEEKSVENHNLSVSVPADLDLSADADYRVSIRYEVKLDCTHAKQPVNDDWIKFVVNGRARVWGERGEAVEIAPMDCARNGAMVGYRKRGVWFSVCHDIPVAKLAGGKLKKFETNLFNDTGKYKPEPSDGIDWNNDTGVRFSVRDIRITTDRPRD